MIKQHSSMYSDPLVGRTNELLDITTHLLKPDYQLLIASFEDYDASQLLLAHTRRVEPQFDWGNDHEAVIQICIMTAKLRLAIELAASWLNELHPSQMPHGIEYEVLATTTRNGEEHHRSIRAAFDHARTLLSEHERIDSSTTSTYPAFRAAAHAGAEATHQQLLTAREQEILGLMAAGMTNPQIAVHLVIGAGTVKTHTLNIYRKLKVANRTQAIASAQSLGYLRT
jgi:DNA-binding CsgD family transcriptional regulator